MSRPEPTFRSEWKSGGRLLSAVRACREPARTLDGQLIHVEANIGIHDDVELALDNGADGVGLLRIEQLYFARPVPPPEEELFSELESLIAKFLGNANVRYLQAHYARRGCYAARIERA